jgi:hypothetical protein
MNDRPQGAYRDMSLTYALEAAVNGTTGPRATLFYGLNRTKPRRRRSRTTTNARDSHTTEAAAPAAKGTFLSTSRSSLTVFNSRRNRRSSSR